MTDPTVSPNEERDGPESGLDSDTRLLEWRGDLSELYNIFLVNLVLTVVTLGIYYFWGKTRIRRYVWAHVAPADFPGDRLEYRGRGGEIFVAWIVAMAVLAVGFLGVYGIAGLMGERVLLLAFPFLLAAGFLAPAVYHAAKFGARRYVLSRTRWRGIRFAQTGSVFRMGLYTAVRKWAQWASLHLARPFYEEAKRRCTIDETWFGDRRMRYTGDAGALMGPWMVTVGGIVAVVVGGIVLSTMALLAGGPALGGPEPDPAELAATTAGMMVFQWIATGLMALGVLYFWYRYRARSLAHAARHTHLDDVEFSFHCGGFELFRFELVNWLALAVTLGLAYPWVKVRRVRFTADHLRVDGALDPAEIGQTDPEGPRVGEGFAEALGLDYPLIGVVEI